MNQHRGTLKGVVTALGTPLDRNEDLHEKGMRKQIRMQLAAGVDGLLVLGSMGCRCSRTRSSWRRWRWPSTK